LILIVDALELRPIGGEIDVHGPIRGSSEKQAQHVPVTAGSDQRFGLTSVLLPGAPMKHIGRFFVVVALL
jgi:hypothetical protein